MIDQPLAQALARLREAMVDVPGDIRSVRTFSPTYKTPSEIRADVRLGLDALAQAERLQALEAAATAEVRKRLMQAERERDAALGAMRIHADDYNAMQITTNRAGYENLVGQRDEYKERAEAAEAEAQKLRDALGRAQSRLEEHVDADEPLSIVAVVIKLIDEAFAAASAATPGEQT